MRSSIQLTLFVCVYDSVRGTVHVYCTSIARLLTSSSFFYHTRASRWEHLNLKAMPLSMGKETKQREERGLGVVALALRSPSAVTPLLTIGAVTVVGSVYLSVCLSVCLLLNISPTFVCLAIGTIYSTGSEGQKFCVVFSENAPLQI